jgi:hypothetical protein
MKKKDRSPGKPQSSPNPHPKRRNKKQHESMAKPKKKDSPPGTPIQTQFKHRNGAPRATVFNSFKTTQTETSHRQ